MPRTKKVKNNQVEEFARRLNDVIRDKQEEDLLAIGRRKTQNEIAAEIGISKSTLSKWATGNGLKGIPTSDYIAKLANYFGVNPAWLIGTPGAEKDTNTTLAATGLSAAAISSLIGVYKDYSDMPSLVVASKEFPSLIQAFMELSELTAIIKTLTEELESGVNVSIASHNLPALIRELKYGRYELGECCNRILNDVMKSDKAITRAESVLSDFELEAERYFFVENLSKEEEDNG